MQLRTRLKAALWRWVTTPAAATGNERVTVGTASYWQTREEAHRAAEAHVRSGRAAIGNQLPDGRWEVRVVEA